MKKVDSILSVDRGTKYIGLAYAHIGTDIVMPIGNLMNDGGLFFNISDILVKYRVKKIIVGYPKNHEDMQENIDKFIKSLSFVVDKDTDIERVDEEYTSVEAGATTGDFKKSEVTDTLAAMKILERYMENN